jgi:hypothetical protein
MNCFSDESFDINNDFVISELENQDLKVVNNRGSQLYISTENIIVESANLIENKKTNKKHYELTILFENQESNILLKKMLDLTQTLSKNNNLKHELEPIIVEQDGIYKMKLNIPLEIGKLVDLEVYNDSEELIYSKDDNNIDIVNIFTNKKLSNIIIKCNKIIYKKDKLKVDWHLYQCIM